MSDVNHETNVSSIGFIDKKVFEVGAQFCVTLDEIIPGRQYRESRRLSEFDRAVSAMTEESGIDAIYAQDMIVIVDEKDGHSVYTSELYRGENDELISGKPRPPMTVTPEGWFIPENLIKEEEKATALFADMGQLIVGYLSPAEHTCVNDRELEELQQKKTEHLLFKTEAVDPGIADRYYG